MTGLATVRVEIPDVLVTLGVWVVRTPGEAGPPNTALLAPAGRGEVVVEMAVQSPGTAASGRLVVPVDLLPGAEHTIRLPFHELLSQTTSRRPA